MAINVLVGGGGNWHSSGGSLDLLQLERRSAAAEQGERCQHLAHLRSVTTIGEVVPSPAVLAEVPPIHRSLSVETSDGGL